MSGDTRPPPTACAAETCITCGDAAPTLTVVGLEGVDARCRDHTGRTELVAVDLVGPVAAGDRLVVHAGVAIGRLRPDSRPDGAGDRWPPGDRCGAEPRGED